MRKRFVVLAALCLGVALFAFPAFAQAEPATASVTGTVTNGVSAIPTITVDLYMYTVSPQDGNTTFEGSIDTTGNGAFSFTDLTAGTYYVVAHDASGAYDTTYGDDFVLADGDAKVLPLVMHLQLPYTEFDSSGGSSKTDYSDSDVTWDLYGGLGVYSGPDATVTLSYSIDGAPYATAVNSVDGTFTADGIHTITYFATTMGGVSNKKQTQHIYIDKTAPVTAFSVNGSSVSLTAADAGSGVAVTYWRFGTDGFVSLGTPMIPATGIGTLQFFSIDNAGNYEAVKTVTVRAGASLTKPVASTKKPRANKTFSVKGTVVGRASAAGMVRAYKLVKGKYVSFSTKSFTTSLTGTYSVSFKLAKGSYKFKTFFGGNTAMSVDPAVSSAFSAVSVVK
jgi:hypothetical protein